MGVSLIRSFFTLPRNVFKQNRFAVFLQVCWVLGKNEKIGNSSENLRKTNIAVILIAPNTEGLKSSQVMSLIKSVFPAVKQKERKEKEGKLEGEAVFSFFK